MVRKRPIPRVDDEKTDRAIKALSFIVDELIEDGESLSADVVTVTAAAASSVYPPGHVDGCEVTWNSVSAVDVSAGTVRDSTDEVNIVVGAKTASILTSGANGLDTGTEAGSTWYAVYVISDNAGTQVASLLSESFTAPTLPAGYDVFRRVGAVYNTIGADFRLFYASGTGRDRRVDWDTTITAFTSFTTTTWTSKDMTIGIPPSSTQGRFYWVYENVGGANTHGFFLRPEGSAAGGLMGVTPGIVLTNTSGGAGTIDHRVDSGLLEVKVFAVTNTLWFYITGYTDHI